MRFTLAQLPVRRCVELFSRAGDALVYEFSWALSPVYPNPNQKLKELVDRQIKCNDVLLL